MDPTTGAAAIAAAVSNASESEASKTAGRLLERVLGPAADALGNALGHYTEYRLKNVAQVLAKADQKSRGRSGTPHPRLAHRILEDGSYVEDEVMAEYLSGVLAGSRGNETDDRGVAWAALVASMSSLQVRLHFLVYREWADAAARNPQHKTGTDAGRNAIRMSVDLWEVATRLKPSIGSVSAPEVGHAISGLVRLGLLGDSWQYGTVDADRASLGWPEEIWVGMAPAGMELYGWALGYTEIQLSSFPELHKIPNTVDIPRLERLAFPDC